MYYPTETLPYSDYVKIYEQGDLTVKGNRYTFILGGAYFPASRVVWNIMHPDDLAQPDEEIHHKDGDRTNDDPRNLVKLHRREHRRLHKREFEEAHPIPDGLAERVLEIVAETYPMQRKNNEIAKIVSAEFNFHIGKKRIRKYVKKAHKKIKQAEQQALAA